MMIAVRRSLMLAGGVLALGTCPVLSQTQNVPRVGNINTIGQAIDYDGDGTVSEEERERSRLETKERALQKQRDALLKEFDRDGDGKLSKEEQEAVQAAALAEQQRRHLNRKPSGGKLPSFRSRGPARDLSERPDAEKRTTSRFDLNGDGTISPEEIKALQEGLKPPPAAPTKDSEKSPSVAPKAK